MSKEEVGEMAFRRNSLVRFSQPLPEGTGLSAEEQEKKIRQTEQIEREEREREARGEKVERRVAHLIRDPD